MIVAHGFMSQVGSAGQFLLGGSQIITVRCWLGCNLLKAQLGSLSKMAHSHRWQLMLAFG